MNEKIKELVARGRVKIDVRTGYRFFTRGELEKFTELIIRECCNAADDWYQNHNNIHWDPAQHIRNHLGLEE